MQTHKDLTVWQKSISLVAEIYRITRIFPKEEIYCIVSQLRRAALSIPSNIAEGSARKNTKEYIQFLYISLGSAVELETQLIISVNLDFIKQDKAESIQIQLEEIIRMLKGLIKALSARKEIDRSVIVS
jgi:four helix bundle protein